jgi:sulfate-transporting ATPase
MLLSLGITVIYQASRVLNLAHGAMAMIGAYVTYQLATWHVPLAVAALSGVAAGGLMGVLVERIFVRRLRAAGPTTQTVGTVAVLTLSIALASRIWGSEPVVAPSVLPGGFLNIGSGRVAWNLLLIFPVAMGGAGALFGLFQFTDIGLAMRGAAMNRRGASLRGVDPDMTATLAWVVGGAFAAMTGILLAGATVLDPFGISLGILPAFVAALIGRLENLPAVCLGAVVVGLVQGMVPAMSLVPVIGPIFSPAGMPELSIGLLALGVMAMRGARLSASDAGGVARTGGGAAGSKLGALRERPVVQAVLLTALLIWPLLPHVPYDLVNTAILGCEYLIAVLSIVLLIGLVGQISLGQAALVGLGAFAGAVATHRLGIPFPATLLVGIAAGALSAMLVGVVALRVRGLYLAVATLIFAYICDKFLFGQEWLVENRSGTSIPLQAIGHKGTLPYFDLSDAHVFYYVALAVALLCLYLVANLRDSKFGRAFAALRGSEVAAASLGINVTRFKLLGFCLAGALAGLGGSLTLVGQSTVAPDQFNFANSLYFLAIAAVGGLSSLGGAVASSLLFALLVGEVFFRQPQLGRYRDVVSASALIVVLLFFEGGLGALPARLAHRRERISSLLRPAIQWLAGATRVLRPEPKTLVAVGASSSRSVAATAAADHKPSAGLLSSGLKRLGLRRSDQVGRVDLSVAMTARRQAASTAEDHQPEFAPVGTKAPRITARQALEGGQVAGAAGPEGRRRPVLLSGAGITVKFGGLTAVRQATIEVCAGEIVGLIGPNGAGKTTLFNALLGLNSPAEGKITLYDKDVTSWGVHERAALGVGRTFQILQLFPDLTVFDNLMVATHLDNPTGLWGSLTVSPGARRAEEHARDRVAAVLELMELQEYAQRPVAGLPFGVLRLIEVARTLVTGARLVCFDEPASGLDSTETERLIHWFRFLRDIGITLLVIEHDVDMVVRLCDYIYVLDQGAVIASGVPEQIQRDPAVIASYLGAPVEAA